MIRQRLTLILYPFGLGAMAVNLFFAALIGSWLGLPVLTPLAIGIGRRNARSASKLAVCGPYHPINDDGRSPGMIWSVRLYFFGVHLQKADLHLKRV